MAVDLIASSETATNPLDIVEEIVAANEWPFDRSNEVELVAEITGRWCDYRLHFAWCNEVSALQFTLSVNCRVPDGKRASMRSLLTLVNEQMWFGHFDLCNQTSMPLFRQTQLLRGARGASVEQLEDLVDIAIGECDRFFPAFQFLVWGGKSPVEAVRSALLETVGEA
ncbi:MAG: YbjN domain-containing protein [Alphaproteobacteria bacterium]